MGIKTKALNIRQDTADSRFHLVMKGEEEAYLNYKLHTESTPNVVEFTEIYVPDVLENIGIANEMALEGARFAEKMGYRIKTSCSFMSEYMDRHPEFSHLQV